jgi:thiol:disulfide interchange protein DsbD
MKRLLPLLFFTLLALTAPAQVLKTATWTAKPAKPTVKVGETVDILFTATLKPNWHVFSSDQNPEVGPIPTSVKFAKSPTFALVGKLEPVGKPVQKQDELFGGPVRYFEGKATFRQRVKILAENPKLSGEIEAQTCSDVDGQCVLAGSDFKITKLNVVAAAETPKLPPTPALASPASKPDSAVAKAETPAPAVEPQASAATAPVAAAPVSVAPENGSDQSLWGFFLVALAAGFAAMLTPCVYPIIPMTVSYFTHQPSGRGHTQAVVYGLSIIGIYVLFGTLVSWLFGASFANFLATHWFPNLLFFAVFVAFGLSFLGLFEIVLPSSFVNKMDAQAEKGGLTGVFFMAFTLVLVGFSCTGPIAGSILIASAQGEVLKPVVGMLGFSLPFAVVFTGLAFFPEWLKSLPKSGGWLNSVKVVFGFLELAFALKFLSTADQVYHWHLLDREVYLAFWIVLFGLIGFYLLGKIQLPHDSKLEKIPVPRMLLAIFTFAFVVYLIPGMFGAPLRALAGYLPPETTFDPFVGGGLTASTPASAPAVTATGTAPRFSDKFKLPHGLTGYFDFREALAAAKRTGKPVFIDFTGHGCVNCREMEARVWSQPEVLSRLRTDFVIAALYVDDKTDLPAAEHYTSTADGKVKDTIGGQNLDLQITRFGSNAQPHYCLVDASGNLLVPPRAYDLDATAFARFLDAGKAAFSARQVAAR